MVVSTVVIAALQRASGADGAPLLLAKGGVYLELQLGLRARATQDINTLFRGSVEQFEEALSDVLSMPWGPFTLQATDAFTNDRVRDVIDLLLLRDHFYAGGPSPELKSACIDVSEARAAEATFLGAPTRH